MAKSKAVEKKGQKSITAFFGGGKKDAAKASEPEDVEMDVEDDEVKDVSTSEADNVPLNSDGDAPVVKAKAKRKAAVVEDEEENDAPLVKKAKGKGKDETSGDEPFKVEDAPPKKILAMKKKGGKVKAAIKEDLQSDEDDAPVSKKKAKTTPPDMSTLPPINHIPEMFADMVGKIKEIKEVAERIKGRKLRVATMCSGTESPLLALDMICKAVLDTYDVPLEVEHVFSCEIEPFKQAYIERNFHPPLLFRDVCELGDEEAYVYSLGD